MKSLKQKLAEFETKLKNLSNTKPVVGDKSISVPTYYRCGVVGHIQPNCSFLRKEPKHVTINPSRKTDVPKFVHVCHFCGVRDHIRPNCHKLKFKFVGL